MSKANQYYEEGVRLANQNDLMGGLKCFQKALRVDPNHLDAMIDRGGALAILGRLVEALHATNLVLEKEPSLLRALHNKVYILTRLGAFDEAIFISQTLFTIDPNPSNAYRLAVSLFDAAKERQVFQFLQRAIELFPKSFEFRRFLGATRLLMGDLKRGFQENEYRILAPLPGPYKKPVSSPRWQGETINGKRLLVRCSHGFGDAIQFLRYVPQIKNCEVVVEMQESLHCLFPSLTLTSQERETPEHDLHVDVMSLPAIFQTDFNNIPPPVQIPFSHRPKKNRIGICFRGCSTTPHNWKRSIQINLFEPIISLQDFEFITLQKDPNPEELSLLAQFGVCYRPLNSWIDTLHALKECELVITVDTSIAHLSGSLGIPTWILLPFSAEWRWMLHRTDSPWYPTVRLFRQRSIGRWIEPIREITKKIIVRIVPSFDR